MHLRGRSWRLGADSCLGLTERRQVKESRGRKGGGVDKCGSLRLWEGRILLSLVVRVQILLIGKQVNLCLSSLAFSRMLIGSLGDAIQGVSIGWGRSCKRCYWIRSTIK